MLHLALLVLLGTLASIGALTLIAITYVIRFGDSAFGEIKQW